MKYLTLFILSLVCFINTNAQSPKNENSTVKKELSEVEFIKLKKQYAKMLRSETATLVNKSHRVIGEKAKGLKFPNPSKDKKWLTDEDYTKKWLAANIGKTKFKSVDEAYNLIKESVSLTQKKVDENPEVYKLLGKASKEQTREIFDMEVEYKMSMQE